MAIYAGITQAEVNNYVQLALQRHRDGLVAVKEVNDWLAGVAQADLVTLGFPSAQAQSILSAIADAMAEYQIHYTGQAPGTYPQVTGPYNFSATQEAVIGPLLS